MIEPSHRQRMPLRGVNRIATVGGSLPRLPVELREAVVSPARVNRIRVEAALALNRGHHPAVIGSGGDRRSMDAGDYMVLVAAGAPGLSGVFSFGGRC